MTPNTQSVCKHCQQPKYETGDHADNPCGNCVICTAEKILEELATPASTARTDGELERLRELRDKATHGNWCGHKGNNGHPFDWTLTCWAKDVMCGLSMADCGYISHALNYVEKILDAAPGSVPQAPKCSEPRIVELNPPNAPDKYAVFIGKVFIWEFDYEKEAEELRDNLKRVGVPQAEPPKEEK